MTQFIQAALSLYVFVNFLVLDPSNESGPFMSKTKWVKHGDTVRKINLFDRIRSIFQIYDKTENDLWVVKEGWKSDLWLCPFCLSWWVAFLFTVPYIFLYSNNIFDIVLFHHSLVGTTHILLHIEH